MSVAPNQPAVIFNRLSGLGVLLLGLAGLIAAIAILLHVAQSAGAPLAATTPPAKPGFELVQLGELRRDQFLVDGDSGRVWERVCSGEVKGPDCNGNVLWREMCVEGGASKSAECMARQSEQYVREGAAAAMAAAEEAAEAVTAAKEATSTPDQ
jgi:hypothetical protein